MAFSVSFEELEGSPTENRTTTGFSARRSLKCAWDDRETLATEALEYQTNPYPHSSGVTLYAQAVDVKPFGGQVAPDTAGIAKYEHAIVDVTYGTPTVTTPAGTTEGEAVTENFDLGAQFFRPGVDGFTWGSSSGPAVAAEDAPGIIARLMDWTYTRHNLVSVPFWALQYAGTVNDALILSRRYPGLTFPAETLLMQGAQFAITTDRSGTQKFRVAYRFTFQPQGWNRFFNPKKVIATGRVGGFDEMYFGGARFAPFPLRNFLVL